MALDPLSAGGLSGAHVSLHVARQLRTNGGFAGALAAATIAPVASTSTPAGPGSTTTARAGSMAARASGTASTEYTPHTAIRSSSGPVDANQWDGMLNRLGQKYNVPPLFLKAVMLSESGGRPDAVGDAGHSVGLFQLHDQGYGHGMGDARYDPEINAERATQGLAEAWHAGQRAGYSGEYAVRAAYDYSFNPGGGFAYQGDSVVRHYNQLLAEQGMPTLR